MNTDSKIVETKQCDIHVVSNSLLDKIYADKPAMCRVFNTLVGSKLRSVNLDFQQRPYEGSYYILISPKKFGINNVRSTVHIEIDDLAQLQIRELGGGTHYINVINEKLSKFVMQKGWVDSKLRSKKINELEYKKRQIEKKLLGVRYFNYC
jgi:hypothetical protein